MSRLAAAQSPIRLKPQIARLLLVCGLLTCVTFAKADELDTQPPIPQVANNRAKFDVPNRNGARFKGRLVTKDNSIDGGIQDYTPLASQTQNSDEYDAWHIVLTHAKQFKTEDLEQHADRELVRDDLLHSTTPSRSPYRLDLIRFDGKLTKVRWLKATKSLVEAGTAKIYEGTLIPFDEPPNGIVSIVFSELPPELATVDQKPENEWVDVNQDVNAAGFFFKIRMDGTGPEQPSIPILIGRSVTIRKPAPQTPVGEPAENPILLDKNLRVFRRIKDDAFIAKTEQNWEEGSAWNRILLHSRRFTAAELDAAATERSFADLFTDSRKDYKLDLVKFEGRLIMVNKMKPSEKLQAAGIEAVYEGWIVPKNEPRGNPICVVFTEPVESLEGVNGRVNRWVTFAGYSFKLMRYASGERDKDDATKNVTKKAPLVLGRAVIERLDPDTPRVTWGGFVPIVTAGIIALIVVALGLSWWFRRGDKQTRQEIENHRGKNPFGEAGPAVS